MQLFFFLGAEWVADGDGVARAVFELDGCGEGAGVGGVGLGDGYFGHGICDLRFTIFDLRLLLN
ncbi:MAG: hypothetical protein IPG51_02885 [Chloroflexi bacterium]|nr:hypothetical protein [Chloroflexota bacterium]